MKLDNLQLMLGLSNEIYLGSMKKNSKYPVMNESRVIFTDQVIRAASTHLMNMTEGNCYEFPGKGKLTWVLPDEVVVKKSELVDEERVRFKMDENGNLTRIEEEAQ